MGSDLRRNPNGYSFPFDRLPEEIQSRIFSLLPITNLVVCKAVSRSWRSIIRSPVFTDHYRLSRDPIFLFYGRRCLTDTAHAYLLSNDRWVQFHFPQQIFTIANAGTSLLLVNMSQWYYIVNPFSLPHPIHFLPRVYNLHSCCSVLALIERTPSDYTIVVVSPTGGILHTHTYDSRSGCWEERGHLQIGWQSIDLGNAVYVDGLLHCMSHLCRTRSRLLMFDPVGGQWSMLDLDLPVPLFRSHLLGFEGKLYLTGFFQEDMVITRIGIWELDRSAMAWKEFDLMPDKYLTEFSSRRDRSLSMVDCRGVICFSSQDPKEIVLCDLTVRRWWCPRPCNIPGERGFPIGCAIEPHINLLK